VRPGPQVNLVLVDLRVRSGLEGVRVVGGHVEPGGVVEPVNPSLAVGLVTLDGADVVGLAVVVPGDDLDNVDLVAVVKDGLPPFGVQVVIRHVDPLKTTVRTERGKILWDTYVLVEGVRSVMGEEPRRDSSHVSLSGAWRHVLQTTQVHLVGLDGTDEIAKHRRAETSGITETSTKGLEETGSFLSGQLNGPARVPVVNTVDDVAKVLECVRVDEEGGNEVNLVVSGELVDELGFPALDGGTGTESAGVSGESGGKDMAVVLQLVGVIGITSDVVTERSSVIWG